MLLFTEEKKADTETLVELSILFKCLHVFIVIFFNHCAIFTEIKIFTDVHQCTTLFFLPKFSYFSSQRKPPFTAEQK